MICASFVEDKRPPVAVGASSSEYSQVAQPGIIPTAGLLSISQVTKEDTMLIFLLMLIKIH